MTRQRSARGQIWADSLACSHCDRCLCSHPCNSQRREIAAASAELARLRDPIIWNWAQMGIVRGSSSSSPGPTQGEGCVDISRWQPGAGAQAPAWPSPKDLDLRGTGEQRSPGSRLPMRGLAVTAISCCRVPLTTRSRGTPHSFFPSLGPSGPSESLWLSKVADNACSHSPGEKCECGEVLWQPDGSQLGSWEWAGAASTPYPHLELLPPQCPVRQACN